LNFRRDADYSDIMYDLKLTQRLTLIKSSLAISHVSWLKFTDVSGTFSIPIIRVMSMSICYMFPVQRLSISETVTDMADSQRRFNSDFMFFLNPFC